MVSPLLPELLSLDRGDDPDDVEDPWLDVVEEACAAVAVAELRRRVHTLPTRERKVISSRYGVDQAQKTHRAIARELDVAVGTVCNIEKRALTMLRALYDADAALLENAA